MIDASIRTYLSGKVSSLNFKALLELMESTGIEYRDRKLRGPVGIATYYCIYLDLERLMQAHDKLLFFVIVHEIAHFKRIMKIGGKDGIIKLMSVDELDTFCENVFNEEIFADRYACYVYWLLNKDIYPRENTQELHLPYNQKAYRVGARHLFGVVQNNEENYKRLLESFVYEV